MAQLKVYNPEGFPPKIDQLKMADRPGALGGRTVYLVDCRFDDGDILMEQMGNWFGEHMPSVKVEIRRKDGVYHSRDDRLYEEIKAKGDAAIVGVGH